MNKVEQIIITNKAKKEMDCLYLRESRYKLFVCTSPLIIERAKKLPVSDRIIINCCGIFQKQDN